MGKKSRATRGREDGAKRSGGSSFSRSLGESCPIDPAPWPEIPRTEIGILDTTRWKLDIGPLLRDGYREKSLAFDVNRLLAAEDMEWRKADVTGRKQAREELRLVRLRDGGRISVYEKSIALEVAAPRVKGYANNQQDMLSAFDSLAVLRELPQLFPMTTFIARQKYGREWFASRLDLAVNFEAPIARLVEAYRTAKHPNIHAKADAFGSTGLGLYGTTMDVILYSLERKLRRSKLARKLDGKMLDPARGIVRLEVRLKKPESVMRVLQEMMEGAVELPPGAPTIPCLLVHPDGFKRIVPVPFVNHELHRQVAREVLKLSGGKQLSKPVAKGNLVRHYGLVHLSRHPEDMVVIEESCERKTAARIRKQVAALHMAALETSLVRLAWPHPQARRGGPFMLTLPNARSRALHPADTVSVGTTRQVRGRSPRSIQESK